MADPPPLVLRSAPPKKARRSGRRGPLHPETASAEIRSRAAANTVEEPLPAFEVRLHRLDGTIRRLRFPSYAAAVETRTLELKTGSYSHAWIELLTYSYLSRAKKPKERGR